MNVALLEKITEAILVNPTDFSMDQWHCETTHCIGGWAQRCSGVEETTDVQQMAELLGIEYKRNSHQLVDEDCQAGRLFLASLWPKVFRDVYYATKDNSARAQVAAARISHFIATEGRE